MNGDAFLPAIEQVTDWQDILRSRINQVVSMHAPVLVAFDAPPVPHLFGVPHVVLAADGAEAGEAVHGAVAEFTRLVVEAVGRGGYAQLAWRRRPEVTVDARGGVIRWRASMRLAMWAPQPAA